MVYRFRFASTAVGKQRAAASALTDQIAAVAQSASSSQDGAVGQAYELRAEAKKAAKKLCVARRRTPTQNGKNKGIEKNKEGRDSRACEII